MLYFSKLVKGEEKGGERRGIGEERGGGGRGGEEQIHEHACVRDLIILQGDLTYVVTVNTAYNVFRP